MDVLLTRVISYAATGEATCCDVAMRKQVGQPDCYITRGRRYAALLLPPYCSGPFRRKVAIVSATCPRPTDLFSSLAPAATACLEA